jgi:hypothetical protein
MIIDQARELAQCNVNSSLISGAALPDQVFKDGDLCFRFFQSDRMFSSSFIDIISEFISIEQSTSVCLLNTTRANSSAYGNFSAIFIESGMTAAQYDAELRRGGPAEGWLFSMDHYGCASDIGRWIIYCEKDNDVAVVALRGWKTPETFSSPLGRLGAEAIDSLIEKGPSAPFPFSNLVPNWRGKLSKLYGGQSTLRGP